MMKKFKFTFTASWDNQVKEHFIEFFFVGNDADALEQAKVLFEARIDALSTIISVEPIERSEYRFLDLYDGFKLFGFDSEEDMFGFDCDKYTSASFDECSAYSGLASECEPKEEWVERESEMEHPHRGYYWYKSYNGDKYCKNHYRWSFETALDALGNPKYIIVFKTKK
jgi:hypothetical protein